MRNVYTQARERHTMDATREPSVRSFWYSVTLVIVFNSIFLAWVLFKPGTQHFFVLGDDIGQVLGWLLATFLCFVGMKRPWRTTADGLDVTAASPTVQRWVPLLFAVGIFCQCIGQVIYTYYDIHNWAPFPSWADVSYLSTFPFLLLGILLLPIRPLSGITRSRVLLDGLIIMTALVTFSWYFVLGPTMLQGDETVIAKITGSAYPFFDLVLIFCVLRISFRTDISALRSVVLLLSVGLIIIVITDSIYDYQTLQNTYVNGLQDVGWPIGYMLIGLAAQAFNIIQRRRKSASETSGGDVVTSSTSTLSSEWNSLLPYVLIPAVIALTVYTWRTNANQTLANGVYVGGFSLLGMILLRQFFAIRETIFYNKELHRMQQELHRKNEALSMANRQLEAQALQVAASYEQQLHLNELKDQFLLNVNHELRTPLTEMQGYLDLLREHTGSMDQSLQTRFIEFALHGCEELQRLISTILDAIRGSYQETPLHIDVVPIAGVVHDVLDLFEPRRSREYSLEVNIPETLAVKADREYLHRIILNLLSNAFKYVPKETAVIISAQPYTTHEQKTDVSENSAPPIINTHGALAASQKAADLSEVKYICISVKDMGPGIPPAEIPLLFEKFVRLQRDIAGSIRGTGLGLYICKQLVEAQEGRIWVESSGRAGEGSCFCFILPAVSPALVEEEHTSLPSVMVDMPEIMSL
jgi:signal transduction histidine kinase